MELSRDQLLDDFSLLAYSNQEIIKNENIIEYNNNSINELLQKELKIHLNIFLAVSLLLSFFIMPRFIGGFPALLLIIVCIFLYRYCKKSLKKTNSFYMNSPVYKKQCEKILQKPIFEEKWQSIDKANQTKEGVYEILNEVGVLNRIPEKYVSYRPSLKIFTYLINSRADTLKEALNLYEQESHQERMESKQDYMINKIDQAAMDARAAKIYSSYAAASSSIAAANSWKAAENSEQAARYSEQAARNSS